MGVLGVYLSDPCLSMVHIMFGIRMVFNSDSNKNSWDKRPSEGILGAKPVTKALVFLTAEGYNLFAYVYISNVCYSVPFFWRWEPGYSGKKMTVGWEDGPWVLLWRVLTSFHCLEVQWRLLWSLWLVHTVPTSLCVLLCWKDFTPGWMMLWCWVEGDLKGDSSPLLGTKCF